MTTTYKTHELATGKFHNCWKCSGTGTVDWARHVANGVCFACNGTGRVAAGEHVEREGVSTFVAGEEYVWQFQKINHGEHGHWTAKKGERVDSVMIQAFKLGANRRTGTTILRCRLIDLELAREVWRDAKAGKSPEEVADARVAHLRKTCAMSENRRGVEMF